MTGRDLFPIAIALAAVIAAQLQMYGIEPGWMFWDSHRQWSDAYDILEFGLAPTGPWRGLTSQWPLFMTFSKVAWLSLGLSPADYGLFQAWLLNFSIGFMAYRVSGSKLTAITAAAIIVMNPIVWNYAVFHSADVSMASMLLLLLGFLSPRSGRISSAGIMWSTAAIFLLRKNGVTVLPVAALLAYAYSPVKVIHKRIAVPAAISSVAILLFIAEAQIPVRPMEVMSPGIIRRNFYLYTLSPSEFLENALGKANVKPNAPWDDTCLKTMWCRPLFGTRSSAAIPREGAAMNIAAHLRAAVADPESWWRAFFAFASYDLGIADRLHERELGYVKVQFDPRGIWLQNDSTRLQRGLSFRTALGWWDGILIRPWIHFTAAIFGWLILRLTGFKKECAVLANAAALAAAVYVPLLFVSLNSEVRYYFPAGLLLISAMITVFLEVARSAAASPKKS